jgi:hypothetical protein
VSVLELQLTDAVPDEKLDLEFLPDWSAMRSANSEREMFAYTVKSDSGNSYETEVFVSDLGSICGWCGCLASELGKRKCRHVRAVLADVMKRDPEFGKNVLEGEATNG